MPTLHVEHHLSTGQALQVYQGDLTEETTDAIVNAANESLLNGAGVAGAIIRRGGDSIQDECDQYTNTYREVPTGQVAVTSAGTLVPRYVIHAVGPIWQDGQHNEPALLQAAVLNSLAKADELQLTSIAFPAISSGIFGFPKDLCAQIFITTVLTYFQEHPKSMVQTVRFTNIDLVTTELFSRTLQTLAQPAVL